MFVRKSLIVAAFALFLGAASAQEAPVADAKALFAQGMDYAKGLSTLSFDIAFTSEVAAGEQKSSNTLTLNALFQDANKMRLRSATDKDEALIYSDGTERHIHLVTLNKYVKGPAPADRREALMMAGGGPIRMISAWLGEYLTAFPDHLSTLKTAELTGKEKLTPEGPEVNHLRLGYDNFDVELYLTAGEQPAPQRIVIDFTKSISKNAGGVTSMKISGDVSNWNAAPEIAADAFGWRPPAGLEMYTPPAPQAQSGELPTLGAPAPDFKLASLDGGEIALSSHKDKDIVILDFFASWCGPCRMAMPVVHELAESYADKNVKLYAVNVREQPEKIKQFLASAKLEGVAVLLDKSGEAATNYGAQSIPRLVVVGKDGTVQSIHAGFSPYLKQKLGEDIDKLLDGQTLAPAKS
jgi:thiol-disulfide isomerase/thioredoxin